MTDDLAVTSTVADSKRDDSRAGRCLLESSLNSPRGEVQELTFVVDLPFYYLLNIYSFGGPRLDRIVRLRRVEKLV